MTTKSQQLSPDVLKLYQHELLKHHKTPEGFELEFDITHRAEGVNAACGDEIIIYMQVTAGIIVKLGFAGDSCAICRASASMMCQYLINQPIDNIEEVTDNIIAIISSTKEENPVFHSHLMPLLAVRKFPVRKQCAILPWRTFTLALSTC